MFRKCDAALATTANHCLDPDGARRRWTYEERIAHLQAENVALVSQRDMLYEALFEIAHRCLLKGVDVEDVMHCFRKR